MPGRRRTDDTPPADAIHATVPLQSERGSSPVPSESTPLPPLSHRIPIPWTRRSPRWEGFFPDVGGNGREEASGRGFPFHLVTQREARRLHGGARLCTEAEWDDGVGCWG